jgi:hypothetical protein
MTTCGCVQMVAGFLHALFNDILKLLYLGCQWKELPIEKADQGKVVAFCDRNCNVIAPFMAIRSFRKNRAATWLG